MAGTNIFGDVWVLDTETMAWSEQEGAPLSPEQRTPAARSGHAAAVVGGCVYVMGGLSLHAGQVAALDDLWCLDPVGARVV
jgi:hypothetical protein